MEKLAHIHKCPDCGNSTIQEQSMRNKHCNGYWNEKLHFTCGYIVTFSPNFMSEVVENKCVYSKEAVEIANKQKAFKQKLAEFIKKADIDDAFRKRVTQNVQYL